MKKDDFPKPTPEQERFIDTGRITPEQAKEILGINETNDDITEKYVEAIKRGDYVLPLINCRACKHWIMKAEVKKAWGVCDNPKNEVLVSLRPQLGGIISDNLIHKLENLEDNIRYPEDFGCIFFEPK